MSNWTDALTQRKERRDLVARVLEVSVEFYMMHGRWPTVDEIARAIGLE